MSGRRPRKTPIHSRHQEQTPTNLNSTCHPHPRKSWSPYTGLACPAARRARNFPYQQTDSWPGTCHPTCLDISAPVRQPATCTYGAKVSPYLSQWSNSVLLGLKHRGPRGSWRGPKTTVTQTYAVASLMHRSLFEFDNVINQ